MTTGIWDCIEEPVVAPKNSWGNSAKKLYRESRLHIHSQSGASPEWAQVISRDTQNSIVEIGSIYKQVATVCRLDYTRARSASTLAALDAIYKLEVNMFIDLSEVLADSNEIDLIIRHVKKSAIERNEDRAVSLSGPAFVIAQIEQVLEISDVNKALDCLYLCMDPPVENADVLFLDELFEKLNPDRVNLTIAIGYLTSTLPIKRKIRARKLFMKRLKLRLKREGRDHRRVLAGL